MLDGGSRRFRGDGRTGFEQVQDSPYFSNSFLQLVHGIGRQFLRRSEVIGIVEVLFLQPLESVELEFTLRNFGDRERAPAIILRVGRFPLGPSVRVTAVAALECPEVGRR